MHKFRILVGLCDHIKRPCHGIDHRCRNDSYFCPKCRSPAFLQRDRHCGCAINQESSMPKRIAIAAGIAVSVKGIDTVMHSCYIDDVMNARAGNRDARKVKGLPNYLSIDGLCEKLSEVRLVYVLRRENGFAGVCAGTQVVIVPRGHGHLAPAGCQTDEDET